MSSRFLFRSFASQLRSTFALSSWTKPPLPSISLLSKHTPNPTKQTRPSFNLHWTRHYKPKIYFRHDIMRNILAKFLDSKGVPQPAIESVITSKHYYKFHKEEFEHFERVVVWLSSIGLHSGEGLGSILLQHPNFLWIDINILESKMRWFISELGFHRHEIGGLLTRNPNLLFHHAEVMGHFIQALEMLKIDNLTIKRLLHSHPGVIEHCEDIEEFQVSRVLKSLFSFLTDLKSLVRWLTMTLRLSLQDCRQLILQVPLLLNPINQERLPKWYEYLSRMGMDLKQIQKVILENPNSLLKGASQISKIAKLLRKNFNLRQKAIVRIFVDYPEVLNLEKIQILRLKEFLKELKFTSDERFYLILRLPGLLLKNVPYDLTSKSNFLMKKMKIPNLEIKEFPECFLRDFKFIRKRYGYLERFKETGNLDLKTVLQKSDRAFAESIPGSTIEKYRQFEDWWMIKFK